MKVVEFLEGEGGRGGMKVLEFFPVVVYSFSIMLTHFHRDADADNSFFYKCYAVPWVCVFASG